MTILAAFLALVDPIMDGRAYRGVAPDGVQAPYAVFARVASVPGVTLDENGGADNESETRIQLDIYGAAGDVDARAAAVRSALKTWHISNVIQLELDSYESEVKLHRTMLDIATIHQ
ncbi:DUF3168 domain-containing protein [Massilia sp. Leaf139]|uniref:tail completion protein gp17 n=1 Tax=Massilia sp. Leaf139 TaxID=1736272 RepID=UPI0006F1E3EB|nr:DUF3168 domain-containing protein [Massilia sp. Leaf139]KQQ89926.1 hypothetical protein ASF77_23395 [Massilia sp. Leaf139]